MGAMLRICELSELQTRRAMRVTVNEEEVALFLIEGELFAVQNDCPHQHVQAIANGILSGHQITCPMHGWTYDVRTGNAVIGAGRLKRYTAVVKDDAVWIQEPGTERSW